MASDDDVVSAADSTGPFTNPWPAMVYGLAAGSLALLLFHLLEPGAWPGLRVALLATALLAGGIGVAIRPRAPEVVGAGALIAILCYWGTDNDWDSAVMVEGVLAAVAAVAALLLLLPRTLARVVFSLLVVFHLGGIVTAVLSVSPPSGQPPWLTSQIWTRVYRPYLQFMYMHNAYHFYSPEPGPATLLWSCIRYEDGSTRWVKLPNRHEHYTDPLGQEYYRRLSLTESINQTHPIMAVQPKDLAARQSAGEQYPGGLVPMHPYIPQNLQYSPPQAMSRNLLPCYARHLAHAYPHPTDPNIKITGIKMYRLRHMIVPAADFTRPAHSPNAKFYFQPYYQGDYDTEGKLLNPNDQMLWWLIPIYPIFEHDRPETDPFKVRVLTDINKARIVGVKDCLKVHAGSDPWGDEQ